jgi:hypothetical protein
VGEAVSPPNLRYNKTVRRALSFVLLLLFSLPLISPLLALSADSEANLPACCRRNGAHLCFRMIHPAEPSAGTQFSTIPKPCPAYPATVVTPLRHNNLSLPAASLLFAEIVSHPALKLQTEARARVALDRARQKRGPPSFILL